MFRLYNNHPQANTEQCSGTKSLHSMGSHFVYNSDTSIHKILGYIVYTLLFIFLALQPIVVVFFTAR